MNDANGNFAGKVGVIFGAGRPQGVGRAVALRLLRGGAAGVVLSERVLSPDGAGQLADTAGSTLDHLEAVGAAVRAAAADPSMVRVVPADITDAAAVDAVIQDAIDHFGHVDVCASTAGGMGPNVGNGRLSELTDESFANAIAINFTSAWFIARAAARPMKTRGTGGSIVLMSSSAAEEVAGSSGAFGACKAGVDHMCRYLAVELASHQIRVNTVRPRGIDPGTGANNPSIAKMAQGDGQSLAEWTKRIPLGRFQSADETAAVMAFLLSNESSFVTGECWNVTGGPI